MYFSHRPCGFWPQATIGSSGFTFLLTATRCFSSVHFSSVNRAWRAASAVGSALGETAGAGSWGADALGAGAPGASADAPGLGAFARASVTARPWVVAPAEGAADSSFCASLSGAEADGEPLADGLGEPLAEGLGEPLPEGWGASGSLRATARTGRKNSCAVVPTCWRACSWSVPLGMFTMMFSRPWVWTSAS